MPSFSLGEPVFLNTSMVRAYCENGRNLIRPLANELRIGSEELRAALKEVRSHNPLLLGVDTKIKAKIVASHLVHAAEGIEQAAAGFVRCYLSFEKHFLTPNNVPVSRRGFDLDS